LTGDFKAKAFVSTGDECGLHDEVERIKGNGYRGSSCRVEAGSTGAEKLILKMTFCSVPVLA
jgi:hypothetical protein